MTKKSWGPELVEPSSLTVGKASYLDPAAEPTGGISSSRTEQTKNRHHIRTSRIPVPPLSRLRRPELDAADGDAEHGEEGAQEAAKVVGRAVAQEGRPHHGVCPTDGPLP